MQQKAEAGGVPNVGESGSLGDRSIGSKLTRSRRCVLKGGFISGVLSKLRPMSPSEPESRSETQ